MFPSDIDLINKVKQEQDSNAISELVNRHSGCYLSVVNKYCSLSSGKLSLQDLSDEKMYNIYQYAQSYDPTRETKFSTYVTNMARYTCLNALKEEPSVKQYLDAPTDAAGLELWNSLSTNSSYTTNENLDKLDIISAIDKVIKDENFKKILVLRHSQFIPKALTWKEIGVKLGLSHEGCRKIYNRNIKLVSKYLKE